MRQFLAAKVGYLNIAAESHVIARNNHPCNAGNRAHRIDRRARTECRSTGSVRFYL
jgi:hypothetical protein